MIRTIVTAIAAGLAMFVWGYIAHMVLPIGTMGFSDPTESAEPALRAAIDAATPTSGLYMVPGMHGDWHDEKVMAAHNESMGKGPTGIMVITKSGATEMTPGQLATEFGSNFLAALIAGFLLARSSLTGFLPRVFFVAMIGFAAWASIEISYWNWYGFPREYALAQLVDQVCGFAAAGLVLAKFGGRSA